MNHKLFISYRRTDSPAMVGRIYDHLARALDKENVFKDIDDIPLGVDFYEHIKTSMEGADILLAVIGVNWVDSQDEFGELRLMNPDDWVRLEIELAQTLNLLVVPIFVEGVESINADKLPNSLKWLSRRNGIKIRHDPDFHRDMKRLIGKLNEIELSEKTAEIIQSVTREDHHLAEVIASSTDSEVLAASIEGENKGELEENFRMKVMPVFSHIVPDRPAVLSEVGDDQKLITVIVRASHDKARDILRVRRLHGMLLSYAGHDKFAMFLIENGRGIRLEYPTDTTNANDELRERLERVVGRENVRVERIVSQ